MPPRKKSGRITLRMDPDVHSRVEKASKALGMDINGLLNMIIRKNLPDYENLVNILEDAQARVLLARWRELCPSRPIDEFYVAYSGMRRNPDFIIFADGTLFRLNEAGDNFVPIKAGQYRYERIEHGDPPKE